MKKSEPTEIEISIFGPITDHQMAMRVRSGATFCDHKVDKFMERWTEKRSKLNTGMGQVRIRFDLSHPDPPKVETFGKAKRLSD